MANKRKPLVPDYVTDMVATGSTELARKNMDVFVQQMLEATPALYHKALDIAKQDADFRADVFTKLSREIHEAMKANNAMSQKVVDDAYANNELTRKYIEKLLEDGQISPAEFEFLFADLRYYHNEMKVTRRETQEERERMLREEKEAAVIAAEKSGIGIGGYIASGIGLIGSFIAGYLIGKRK